MNTFQQDKNNEEIFLSTDEQQIMMEWEKPYMEQSIDFLSPKGHVLEIGFGCGYSATQILKYPIKSYTIVECDPGVIERIKKWREKYPNILINIIQGPWQSQLGNLGIFDEIYFDDFPLNINKESTQIDIAISRKRIMIFLDLCIQNHTKIGSKICFYLNQNNEFKCGSDSAPFTKVESKTVDIKISDLCRYRDLKEQKCTIPLITKIKEYSFEEAQKYCMMLLNQ